MREFDKDQVPNSLQLYVNEAIGLAEEQLQRSPNLRKISVVKTPVSEASSPGKGFFKKKKKEDEQTNIVFAFDEALSKVHYLNKP